jgi:hypothetical protein
VQSNPDGPREPEDTSGDASAAAQEQAWQAIVQNYGERADLDDLPEPEPPVAPAPPVSSAPFGGRFGNLTAGIADDEPADVDEQEERYEPPPPPPVPRASPDRMAAWLGVFGSPVILLAGLIFGIDLPDLIGYGLVASFVGGFVYLVYRMPRGPRDPWDDGAQV